MHVHVAAVATCIFLVQRITAIHVLLYTFDVFSSVRPQVPKDGQHLMG